MSVALNHVESMVDRQNVRACALPCELSAMCYFRPQLNAFSRSSRLSSSVRLGFSAYTAMHIPYVAIGSISPLGFRLVSPRMNI